MSVHVAEHEEEQQQKTVTCVGLFQFAFQIVSMIFETLLDIFL